MGRDLSDLGRRVVVLGRRVQGLERRVAVLTALVSGRTQRVVQSIGPLEVGIVDVPVEWPRSWLDDTYMVLPELATGPAGLGNVHATLKVGTRTPGACVVSVGASAPVAVVLLDVLGLRA